MKFIHVTDLHLVPPAEKLWGLDPFQRLDACLQDISRHHGDASFCVITGDLTERGDMASYEVLKRRLTDFLLPVRLLLGNHDNRANFRQVFGGEGFLHYAEVNQGGHFLFLDTLKDGRSSAGQQDEPRLAWLQNQLAQAQGAPIYLFMHHPPLEIHHELMDRIKLDESEAFGDLLAGHQVRHLFFGHAHRTISGHWRGISFSALPGLNHQLPLVGGSVPTVYSDEPPMYSVVHLNGDQITVHSDAYMHRRPAEMLPGAERETWF